MKTLLGRRVAPPAQAFEHLVVHTRGSSTHHDRLAKTAVFIDHRLDVQIPVAKTAAAETEILGMPPAIGRPGWMPFSV